MPQDTAGTKPPSRRARSPRELLRRYLLFFIGLLFASFGVALITKANLGTSPISSVPYVLSLFTPLSLGTYTFLMGLVFLLLQILILGRRFPRDYLLQVPVTLFFGVFIDLSMAILRDFEPQHYLWQLLSLLFGCLVLGFGVYLEMVADVVMLSGECLVNAIHLRWGTDFGKTKIGFDSTMTLLAIALSLIFLHTIDGVREGTVLAALLVGWIARIFKHSLLPLEHRLLHFAPEASAKGGSEVSSLPAASAAPPRLPVITISREFGSGGRRLAACIAQDLGLVLHDHDIVLEAAKSLGLSPEHIDAEDQQMLSTLLYDWKAQFYEFSDQKPEKDRLFEEEARLVRLYAEEGGCVILGRCANVLCEGVSPLLRVLLYADEKTKIEKVAAREQISLPEAEHKVNEINRERRRHYRYYTGEDWDDARNYDLSINVSVFTEEEVLEMVRNGLAGAA